MTRRGFTIIELIVAVTLFVTIVTLAFGGFIAIAHLKTQMGDMKETQQKLRTISEMVARDTKEADVVTLGLLSDQYLMLGYNDSFGTLNNVKVFDIGTDVGGIYDHLNYYDCQINALYTGGSDFDASATNGTGCVLEKLLDPTTGTKFTLEKINSQDIFTSRKTIPKTVEISFRLRNSEGTAFGSDKLDYDNMIMLEGAQ